MILNASQSIVFKWKFLCNLTTRFDSLFVFRKKLIFISICDFSEIVQLEVSPLKYKWLTIGLDFYDCFKFS